MLADAFETMGFLRFFPEDGFFAWPFAAAGLGELEAVAAGLSDDGAAFVDEYSAISF